MAPPLRLIHRRSLPAIALPQLLGALLFAGCSTSPSLTTHREPVAAELPSSRVIVLGNSADLAFRSELQGAMNHALAVWAISAIEWLGPVSPATPAPTFRERLTSLGADLLLVEVEGLGVAGASGGRGAHLLPDSLFLCPAGTSDPDTPALRAVFVDHLSGRVVWHASRPLGSDLADDRLTRALRSFSEEIAHRLIDESLVRQDPRLLYATTNRSR